MTTPAEAPSDAELISRTREGDMSAYDELYRRHVDDASRVARIVTNNSDESQDVVAEAFTRVLTRLREGGGPDTNLTPYLRTVVRRLAIDRHRTSERGGTPADPSILEVLPRTDDPMARATDRQLVRQAFETLPDRWQQVLWHTEIEGRSPASLAATLGSTPNAVAALAYRAREGLRQAYLAVNLSSEVRAECRPYAPKVAAYVRGTLSAQHTRAVTVHLGECEHCRERRDELLLLVSDLRGTLWPALLLPAAAGTAVAAGAAAGAAAVAGGGATAAAGASTGAATATGTAVLAGAGATAGGGASTSSAGAAGGAGAAAGASAAASSGGGGAVASIVSPGRLARIGSKTLTGAAGVAAAGIIVAGAFMMLSGSPDDPSDGSAQPPVAGHADDGSGPGDTPAAWDDPTSDPEDPDDPDSDPDDPEAPSDEPDRSTPGRTPGTLPINRPDPTPPGGDGAPQSPDDTDSPSTPDPTQPDDDPTQDPPDDPTSPPPDQDEPEVPPSIDAGPQSTTVRAGQSTTLSVDVSGNPAPSLVWQYRNGSSSVDATNSPAGRTLLMASGGWRNVDGATSSKLTITPTAEHDGRQYRVVARNSHGERTTDPALLTVHYEPNISSSPSGSTVNEGGKVTFTAAASGNPTPTVSWQYRKSGGSWQSADAGNVSQQGVTSRLELSNVKKALDGYEYRAVFANDVGSTASNSASLNVHWRPAVVKNPSSAQAPTGGRATFTAEAEAGNPGPTRARWQVKKNGNGWRDVGFGESTGRNATLNIDVKNANQNGEQYRVVFSNDVGTTESQPATLQVEANASGDIAIASPDGGNQWCVTPTSDGDKAKLKSCSDPPDWTIYTEYSELDDRPNGHTVRWADGRCLSISPAPDEGVHHVQLKPCGNPAPSADQLWSFDLDEQDAQEVASTLPTAGTKVCLDVREATVATNEELIVWNCHGGHNQLFRFE